MMNTADNLYDALRKQLTEVDLQIKHIKNDIALQYPEEDREKINVWYWTYRADGKPVLEELMIARSNILLGMAQLKSADMISKSAARR